MNLLGSLLEASQIIYNDFSDLYDIALFVYEDVKEEII